jgi:hypothetical protein
VKLEVKQTTASELADAERPAEVYGSPTTAEVEDHTASLQAMCRPYGTWVEHP